MAHQWLKWPRPSGGQWNHQPRLVAQLQAQLTGPAKLEAAIREKNLHDFMHKEAMQ
jgi:hypothetical protein